MTHSATEVPCQLRGAAGSAAAANRNIRVCVPASVSILSVVSSCHAMRNRPGTRMIAGAPYDLHCTPAASSRAGSQLLAISRAAGVTGTVSWTYWNGAWVALTVTDEAGNSDSVGETVLVRQLIRCRSDQVSKTGSWEVVQERGANGGSYCRNDDDAGTRDVLHYDFSGPRVVVIHGDSSRGGAAARSVSRSSAG